MKKVSILNTYNGKNILITGCSGFLGKVLLRMILDKIPNIGFIYLLIRKNKKYSAKERFEHEILNSPVFKTSEDQHLTRIKVIEGDVASPNFDLQEKTLKNLLSEIDIVFHVAALIDFFPKINQALAVNVFGLLNSAEFVKKSVKASLVYISTCFVSGCRDGIIKEDLDLTHSPNGKLYDVEQDLDFLMNHSLESPIQLGRERSKYWGWPNAYCYTKSMAERLLTTRYSDISYTIIRPSIVESSISFPFSGWNEGFTTSSPISYIVGTWYPFLYTKKDSALDIVPVDFACNAIIVIGAMVLTHQQNKIYQICSGYQRDLRILPLANLTRSWYRNTRKKLGKQSLNQRLSTLLPIMKISPDSMFSPHNLLKYEKVLKTLKFSKAHIKAYNKTLNWIELVYSSLRPFTYDYKYQFQSHFKNIVPVEKEFYWRFEDIDLKKYWLEHHLPGLNKWIFPLFKKN